MCRVNESKSLVELGISIPKGDLESSLIVSCKVASTKPIGQLSLDDFRILITQSIGLEILIPKAIKLLEEEPLLSTGFFRGDLLFTIIKVPESFWKENKELNNRMMEIKIEVEEIFDTIENQILPLYEKYDFL